MPPLVLATAGCSPPLVFEDADRSTSRIFDGVSSHVQPWRLLAAGSQRGRRRGLLGLLVDGRADDAPRGLLDRERRALVRLPLDDDVVGACVWLGYRVDGVEWRVFTRITPSPRVEGPNDAANAPSSTTVPRCTP